MQDLIESLGIELLPGLQGRFAFFGHSMGTLVSFELARWLRRRRHPLPERLFLSGRGAPHVVDGQRHTYRLSDADLITYVHELNGTPLEVLEYPDARAFFLPLLRADFEAVQTYRYYAEPPLACEISVYGGLADDSAPVHHLELWREHTTDEFSVDVFPGGHFFINEPDGAFMHRIRDHLAATLARPRARSVTS